MGKLTLDQVKQRTLDVGSEFLDGFYVNNSYRHRFRCSACGEEFINILASVTNKKHPITKCEKCYRKTRKSQKLSEEKFNKYKQKFISENKIEILTPYSEYQKNSQKLECRCLICDEIFYKNISNMTSGQMHGCLFVSKGERIALTYFENNGVQYNYQVTLSNGLISDFEILLENGTLHLEINGDQHYEYNERYFSSHEDF